MDANHFIRHLTRLLEFTTEMFYEHVRIENAPAKSELQWVDGSWRFRPVPYEGDWIEIESPLDVPGLLQDELEPHFTRHLLATYTYLHSLRHAVQTDPPSELVGGPLSPSTSSFQMKQIERLLGQERCAQGVAAADAFCRAILENVRQLTP